MNKHHTSSKYEVHTFQIEVYDVSLMYALHDRRGEREVKRKKKEEQRKKRD